MNPKLNLSQKGIFLVSIPLVFELVLVATLAILEMQTEQEVARAFHSARVSDGTNRIVRDLFEIGAVTKGELFSTLSTTAYQNTVQHIREDMKDLKDAVKDDPAEREIVERTNDAAEEAHDEVEKLRLIYESGDTFKAMDELQSARLKMRSCLKRCVSPELINMGQEEKDRLKKSIEIQDEFRSRIKIALIVGVIFNVVLTLIVALVFSRQIVQRLQLLVDNSFRLASGLPLTDPVGGGDEIGALDLSFHAMAQALVEAQRKERALIDNAVDVICSIDTNGRFSAISPACEKVFGYSEQELIGANIAKIILADDLTHAQQALDRIKSGGAEPPFEARLVRKDGRAIDVAWAAHWNVGEQTVFCVAHDITERKDAERMRQEVIQMVTHDLRTPLATIQTFHEMMSTGMFGELSERGQQLLKKAELNGGRMISLINDLLDIEKIKAGGLEIRQDAVPVHDMLDTAGKSISDWAMDRGVLVTTLPTNLTAFADEKRIVQVLVNLLSNAVKFSPKGGTVTLAADSLGDKIVIKVIDQGRGVPEEMRTKIFERFQQVRASDATEKGGSGLGLAICKAIVELHGGRIKVEPNGNQGSVFSFTVPPAPRDDASEPASSQSGVADLI